MSNIKPRQQTKLQEYKQSDAPLGGDLGQAWGLWGKERCWMQPVDALISPLVRGGQQSVGGVPSSGISVC